MDWPAYIELLGGTFDSHPWGQVDGVVKVEDRQFQATKHLPERFPLFEEYYQIKDFNRSRSHVLMSLDPRRGHAEQARPRRRTSRSRGPTATVADASSTRRSATRRRSGRGRTCGRCGSKPRSGRCGSTSRPAPVPPPVELTAEQDHERLMDLLGIRSLRPGADPRNPQAPNPVNYDEAKANPTRACPIRWC